MWDAEDIDSAVALKIVPQNGNSPSPSTEPAGLGPRSEAEQGAKNIVGF